MENHTVAQLKAIAKKARYKRLLYAQKGRVVTRLATDKISRTKK